MAMYAVLSFQIFNQHSFLSIPTNCMPKYIVTDKEDLKNIPSKNILDYWGQIFGTYCASW
jgi:hypothetical protein